MIRRVLAASIRPAPARVALVVALAGAMAMACVLLARDRHRGGWRVDEAYKLSETFALYHLLRGDVHHPDWFRTRIDRTNPPFGKYVFGAAILLAGKPLPEGSSLTRADTPLEEVAPMFSEETSAPFLPLLLPARCVSLAATALIAGLMAYLAARVRGVLAAAIAVMLFAPHWITQEFGASAIFDPLLTFLVMATAPLLFRVWHAPQRAVVIAALAGLLAAFAFQTRLNGAIGFVASIVVFAALPVVYPARRRGISRGTGSSVPTGAAAAGVTRDPASARGINLGALVVSTVVFIATAIAINPYYWASAPPDPAIPAHVRAPRPLVPRVISRFDGQIRELSSILAIFRTGGVRMPLWAAESAARARTPWNVTAKTRYLVHALADGVGGVLLLAGALAGVVIAAITRERSALFLLVWCGTVVGGTCVWLPLPWSRYLFVIVPPLALLAGFGLASLAGSVTSKVPSRVSQRETN